MIIRTKYALLAPGEIRRDVRVEIDGGRIVAVDSGYKPGASHPDLDFGMAVLTPGLVNPHTHLELEFCSQRVPYSDSFLEWLQRIRDLKRLRGTAIPPAPRASLRGMAAAGCTTVLDHHTEVLDWEAIESCGLRYVAFREMFQFNLNIASPFRTQRPAISLPGCIPNPKTTSALGSEPPTVRRETSPVKSWIASLW